jgi:hypothetical protein
MAKDDLKNTKYQYQLVIRDSGPDPVKARSVIRQVITEDKVDAIVGGISLIGQVTKPFATKARIPQTCVCSVMSLGDGTYNFTNTPSPEAEGTLWAREARRRGLQKVALITLGREEIRGGAPVCGETCARTAARLERPDVHAEFFRGGRDIVRNSLPRVVDGLHHFARHAPPFFALTVALLDASSASLKTCSCFAAIATFGSEYDVHPLI